MCSAEQTKGWFFSCTSVHKSGFLGHTNKTDKQTSGPSERQAAQWDNSSRNSVRILSNLKAIQRCRRGEKIKFNNLHGDLICRLSPLTTRSWGRGYQNQAEHYFLILSLADYHLTTWTTLKPPTEKEMRRMCSASIQRKSGLLIVSEGISKLECLEERLVGCGVSHPATLSRIWEDSKHVRRY